MGKKIVISSVSASGKTTLVNALTELYPDIYRLKTCTTRPVRPEENGDEYHFMEKHDMEVAVLCDAFVESSVVYGEYYGLTKEEVESNKDKNVLVILDVKGMKKFKKLYPDTLTIFIEPPPVAVLVDRLKERNTTSEDVHKRINEIRSELKLIKKYDVLIPYGELPDMTADFIDVVAKHIT
jgi:guanylate kinase